MKKLCAIQLIISLVIIFSLFKVGDSEAQYLDCNTVATSPDSLSYWELNDDDYDQATLTIATVSCFIHVLRETSGSGGLSQAEIDSMMNVVSSDFEPLNIFFSVVGQEDLSNSTYYGNPDDYSGSIFAENPHSDAIDIYLGPSIGLAEGRASGIPGSALILIGNLESYSALSHFMGNCLGLYDTDEVGINGPEAANGSNGGVAGDIVSDTPADPGLLPTQSETYVDSNCNLTIDFYTTYSEYSNTDQTNIMSHSRLSCYSSFTAIQGKRIFAALDTFLVLKEVFVSRIPSSSYGDYSSATNFTFPGWSHERTNAAALDFDNDGDKDMIVSGLEYCGPNVNYGMALRNTGLNNDGIPEFVNDSDDVFLYEENLNPPKPGTEGLILADYDNNGYLDFYAPNPNWDGGSCPDWLGHRLYRNNGNGIFEDVTYSVFGANHDGEGTNSVGTFNGSWGDFNGDGYLDLVVALSLYTPHYGAAPSANGLRLYRNNPGLGPDDRVFEDVTDEVGLESSDRKFHSLLWIDLDQDHDMDLILFDYLQMTSLGVSNSRYYLNEPETGNFLDRTSSLFHGLDQFEGLGGMYAAPGDFDADGDIDIVFHGINTKGSFKNDLVGGVSNLYPDWFVDNSQNPGWNIVPSDLDLGDFDLDGYMDFFCSNRPNSDYETYVFRNDPESHGFFPQKVAESTHTYTRGLCAADWNLDGFTELMLASQSNSVFYFRNRNALAGEGHNDNSWVGIRLSALDDVCNRFGIGATVIVTSGGHTQAQIVDGGSGHAGQRDLDLSFGLGDYSSNNVAVKVIWPCGQTQITTATVGQYNTISLGTPRIVPNSVRFYQPWIPGEATCDWIFEWETDYASDSLQDYVNIPSGVLDDGIFVYRLDATMSGVTQNQVLLQNGRYKHLVAWDARPCDEGFLLRYNVNSASGGWEDSCSNSSNVINCPVSP